MTFPQTPLGVVVELFIDGVWTAITPLVLGRDDLVITRARSRESADVDRSTCRGVLNNRDGKFSPRKPTSPYYGKIGRNTLMRVRLTSGPPGYLHIDDPDRANTPDSANLSITGDIDIRMDIRPEEWDKAQGLANKLLNPSQRSWALHLNANGTLGFTWSTTGSDLITKTSTAAVSPPPSGRLAVRVTLDVDNGAAGNTVTFYTAPNIDSVFTQLGATVTTAGVTSIFDSTSALEIGGSQGIGSADDLRGRIYGFQMLQGIAGTLRADVDFNDETAGAATFVDGTSNTWTMVNESSIVTPAIRFVGEVSEWPQRWDITGTDVYVPIEASGILRRLTQGASPLKSTLYRGLTSLATPPRAYWPGEDGIGSTQIASAIAGGTPMSVRTVGTPPSSLFDGFDCSGPLLPVTGTEWGGNVPPYTSTQIVQVTWLMHIPTAATVGQVIISVQTTGTITRWDVVYDGAGGDLSLQGFSPSGAMVVNDSLGDPNLDGDFVRMSMELSQSGTSVQWVFEALVRPFGPLFSTGGSIALSSIGRATRVIVNPGGDFGDLIVGHIAVQDNIVSLVDLGAETNAHLGETAGRRIKRLCSEEGISFRGIGILSDSAAMGPQLPLALVDLLKEAADADGGILYEPHDMFGFAYRTREAMYLQTVHLALDYALNHLSEIEPTDDDQNTRNDRTVSRKGGSSHRAVKLTGPLSIATPPNGVGRYDDQTILNLRADSQVGDAAGWLLHLGTVDEARYPTLAFDLARGVFVSDAAALVRSLDVQDLDVGDRLTVSNPPSWLPPGTITQLAQGFIETLGNFIHTIKVVCAPETPWSQVGRYDDGEARYTSSGSTLGGSLTTTATSVSVSTPTGRLWSHADGDFTIIIGGETMTVTAVTGTTSPQTFTVTRSVNGVVKTHNVGAVVELARPIVYVR